MYQSLSIDDLILLDLQKRINLSDGQINEYSTEISEIELQIEILKAKITLKQNWLKQEQDYRIELVTKYHTLSKQFSNK